MGATGKYREQVDMAKEQLAGLVRDFPGLGEMRFGRKRGFVGFSRKTIQLSPDMDPLQDPYAFEQKLKPGEGQTVIQILGPSYNGCTVYHGPNSDPAGRVTGPQIP
jgi:hypothetical protein